MQCVIMMQARLPPTPYHMRHFQIFGKIDSFLKAVLTNIVLRNLILGGASSK